MNASPYFILAVLWLVYFFLHSLLAANTVKRYLKGVLGKYFKYYQLFYTIFAFLTLLPVLLYNASISSKVLIPDNITGLVKFIGMVAAAYGVIVIRLAFRSYSMREFLGLRQVKSRKEDLNQVEPLRTEGILQYVRHPLYTGTILIVAGFWMFSPTLANLITAAMTILYILIGIRLEEAKLIEMYGEQYKQYKKKVPMLIPAFGKRKKY